MSNEVEDFDARTPKRSGWRTVDDQLRTGVLGAAMVLRRDGVLEPLQSEDHWGQPFIR